VIRVLLVDDHQLVRAGLSTLIDSADDLQVAGAVADGAQALAAADRDRPDVVLMDLAMPVMDGVEATRRLHERSPDIPVLVLTSFSDTARIRAALDAGARGYLLKDSEPQALLDGIRAVARGETALHPRVARAVLTGPVTRDQAELTAREREVLSLVTLGMANKQIGQTLQISERTVKAHLGNIFTRIGVSDRTSAAIWFERHGRAGDGA
jgi:DNA-binding NarL/FixJ family response regulator